MQYFSPKVNLCWSKCIYLYRKSYPQLTLNQYSNNIPIYIPLPHIPFLKGYSREQLGLIPLLIFVFLWLPHTHFHITSTQQSRTTWATKVSFSF